ncbi:hypothetical protein EDF70_110174 [Neorhizobium sp. JUb45]|nr:hypothetical protein EDF70_110174 [Neorhizobium sp. JUb45]
MTHDKGAETPDLDALSPFESAGDFIEDGVDGILRITTVEVWVLRGNEINKLGFNHDTLFSGNAAFGKLLESSRREPCAARPQRGLQSPHGEDPLCGQLVRVTIIAGRFCKRVLYLPQRLAFFCQFIRECKSASLP